MNKQKTIAGRSVLDRLPRGRPGQSDGDMTPPRVQWVAEDILASSERGIYTPDKVFLGTVNGKRIGFADDRHLMTIAGSRAGKGVSCIIPNLLHYSGSVLVIDPKGENARLTAKRRAEMGQTVRVLDPFGRTGEPCDPYRASFNPLSMLKRTSETVIDDAALIADALVVSSQSGDSHWDDTARSFIEGLILHVMTAPQHSGKRTLATVYHLMMHGEDYEVPDEKKAIKDGDLDATIMVSGLRGLQEAMSDNPALDGIVQALANELFDKPDREQGSVISTARRHLSFLRSKNMRSVLESSDFELTDLQSEPTTIYLCLPATRLSLNRGWLRLFINLALAAFEQQKTPHSGPPLLVIMDEFPILGHMRQIEDAAGQVAGFGVKLWPIIQDLSQLKALYKDRWETFVGNSGVIQCFGNNEQTTCEWISKRLGKTSFQVQRKNELTRGQMGQGASGDSWQTEVHDLLTPDEVARYFSRESGRQIIIRAGQPPIALDRVKWYEDSFFSDHVDEDVRL